MKHTRTCGGENVKETKKIQVNNALRALTLLSIF